MSRHSSNAGIIGKNAKSMGLDLFKGDCKLALPLWDGGSGSSLDLTNLASAPQTITNNGATWQTTYSKYYGGAADFSGAQTKWLSIANTAGMYNWSQTQTKTLEFWIRVVSSAGFKGVAATGSYLNNGWEIYAATTSLSFNHQQGSNGNGFGITIPSGQWNHVAFVIGGNNSLRQRAYVNGTLVYDSPASWFQDSNQTNMFVGRRNTWATNDSGEMYLTDFRFYFAEKYTSNFTPPVRLIDDFVGSGIYGLDYNYIAKL